jgi:hypothetical protein
LKSAVTVGPTRVSGTLSSLVNTSFEIEQPFPKFDYIGLQSIAAPQRVARGNYLARIIRILHRTFSGLFRDVVLSRFRDL